VRRPWHCGCSPRGVAHSEVTSVESSTDDASAEDRDEWRTLAARAARTFGTPCYLSRWSPVEVRVREQENPFRAVSLKSWLSFKTHPVRPLARAWIQSGRGVEVVSEAEFVAVRALQCPTSQLLVNGVAKHSWLGRHTVPELRVHFDSVLEARSLLDAAVTQRWRIGLRVHTPAEADARDPRFGGQFGLSADEFTEVHARVCAAGAHVEGVHFHLGQGARPAQAYADAMEHVVALCERSGLAPRYIDCGGGIDATADVATALANLAALAADAAARLPSLREVWLENGRYLTRSSAALIVRVLDMKERPECRYLICDGGRTNHALDADNGVHTILVVPERSGAPTFTTITGPTCMTDDRLGRLMMADDVAPGDLIVWLDAGAYYLPWETRFSHGLCAVVWADRFNRLSLARTRENPEQWCYLWTGNN
jgi:diaminopimelate decarboxylase